MSDGGLTLSPEQGTQAIEPAYRAFHNVGMDLARLNRASELHVRMARHEAVRDEVAHEDEEDDEDEDD